MKHLLLTAAAIVATAVGAAHAQQIYAQVGESITISSQTDASAQGSVSYEWYRNSILIPGSTSATYTIPASLANGENVTFRRRAIAQGCAVGNSGYSNTVTITFCNLVIGGVCWADVNVNEFRTFAARPDMYTLFYQFNRTKAWSNTSAVSGWPTSISENTDWHTDSSPCPVGWRLPTMENSNDLRNNCNPTDGVWAAANSRGNSVSGRFFGDRAISCSLPDDMTGCIFLPSSGHRYNDLAYSPSNLGYYWTSSQYSASNGYLLYFYAEGSFPANNTKAEGMAVRCVR